MAGDRSVSVIVVVHNGMQHIDRCIRSVLQSDYTDLEIIAVDNASTDGGSQHIRRTFPSVIVVEAAENLGYAGGINAGLACATGTYVVPLNMDTEVTPDWLEPMVAFLEANPSAGAVTPKILLDCDRDRVNTMGGNIHVAGLSFCRNRDRLSNDVAEAPESVPGVSGACYVMRKDLLELAGGAPAWCFMGNDDVVLSWTLHLMGYDLYCVPQAVIYHDYELVLDPEKYFILERNRLVMVLSSLRAGTLLVSFPLWVLSEVAILAYSLLKGAGFLRAKLRAYGAVWRDRDGIRQRRRQVRRIRRISDWQLFAKLRLLPDLAQLLGLLSGSHRGTAEH